MGELGPRERFFARLDELHQAAASPPEHVIAQHTKTSTTTVRGWLARCPEKRTVPRNSDQFERLIVFLMQRAGRKQPDTREIRRWDQARRAALATVVSASQVPVSAEDTGRADSVWQGCVEQLGSDGGLPRVADLDPYSVGATRNIFGRAGNAGGDRYVPRTANQVDSKVISALKHADVVVLVGPSKAGKTRTLFEGARRAVPHARMLIPSRGALGAVIDLPDFRDCVDEIVVWLDDLQDFLVGDRPLSPAILAQITARPARTVVAATIRDVAVNRLIQSTGELTRDQRMVLAQGEFVRLGSTSDDDSEQSLAAALYPSLNLRGYGLAEVLAGAPELLQRYDAARCSDPALGAVIQTAIDWIRVGRLDAIPESQLCRLAAFVVEHQWPHVDITNSAIGEAVVEARMPREGSGRVAALQAERLPTGERTYRPFDYLVAADDGQDRPARAIPRDYWAAATHDADPEILTLVGLQAQLRGHSDIAESLWRRGVDAEYPGALYSLAVARHLGGNLREADDLYRRAAAAGCTPAFANIGLLCKERNDLGEAEIWCRRGVEAGDLTAVHNLAVLLTESQRADEAEDLLARAANTGDPDSMFDYGQALRRHSDRMAEVERWFLRAACAGHMRAAFNLACVALDRGDLDVAERWYVRVQQSDADADAEIAMHAAHGLGVVHSDRGNLTDAEMWFRHAAAAGSTKAMSALGVLLMDRGDVTESESWLRRAAGDGNLTAVRFLAIALYQGGNVAAAEELLRPGADAGDLESMRSYAGLLHDRGSLEEAMPYLRRGAGSNHLPSMVALSKALYLADQLEEANYWLERCADAGDLDAMYRLGFRHVGSGDLELGEKWYRRAAERGHYRAMNNLALLLTDKGEKLESHRWLERSRGTGALDRE
ncbi:tetratricopeptide repeat protein [Nocardia sp. NPDC052566]|uniref:tetratricopeptide repeat protein n=1 Tax=Nocardia sp. NPDC052566 TaxID=3364330 RepID=UPI0037C7E08E